MTKTLYPAAVLAQQFAQVFQVYLDEKPEVQEIIRDMTAIVNDHQSNREEIEHALDTLAEALFPGPPNLRW